MPEERLERKFFSKFCLQFSSLVRVCHYGLSSSFKILACKQKTVKYFKLLLVLIQFWKVQQKMLLFFCTKSRKKCWSFFVCRCHVLKVLSTNMPCKKTLKNINNNHLKIVQIGWRWYCSNWIIIWVIFGKKLI